MKRLSKILNFVFVILIFLMFIYIADLRNINELKQRDIDDCIYTWSDYIDSTRNVINAYKDSLVEFKDMKEYPDKHSL